MNLENNLERLLARRHDIESRLNDAGALSSEEMTKLAKELADLRPIADQAENLREIVSNLESAEALLAESAHDAALVALAEEEIRTLKNARTDAEHQLRVMLLPEDADDKRNAILEVRAGTGGDEAALFAADLFAMYQRFAANQGWRFEVLEVSETGIGGYKEAAANITGKNVFARLKFESGVHRVQRVPETETGGRIHTSAATVAVLPEAEEVDIIINEADLRVDVFRASGPGGSRSIRPIRRCESPISPRGLSSANRMKNRNIKIAPRP